MSLKTDFKFRNLLDVSNFYVLNTPAVKGTLLASDSTDLSTVGAGDRNYGAVVAANISVALDREIGVLLYDVTATGPTFENVVVGDPDYSTKAGLPCAIWEMPVGATMSTDQFLATGTGAITAGQSSGNTAAGTGLGIKNGQYVIAASFGSGAGSVVRAFLKGNAQVDGVTCIRVRAL